MPAVSPKTALKTRESPKSAQTAYCVQKRANQRHAHKHRTSSIPKPANMVRETQSTLGGKEDPERQPTEDKTKHASMPKPVMSQSEERTE